MSEGLRVCEDVARFAVSESSISKKLKEIRHSLNIVRKYYGSSILLQRSSGSDLGRHSSYDIKSGGSIRSICGAAFGRAEEAARVIEEFSSRDSESISALMKKARFELYSLEKSLILLIERVYPSISEEFGLYIIMTEPEAGYENLAEAAVKREVRLIQLRDKKMEGRELLKTAKRLKSITRGSGTLLIINDRPDIAALSDADGVHLGQTDISVSDSRALKSEMIVGKSTHSVRQTESACRERPDYIGVGPFYSTVSKKIPDRVLGSLTANRMLKKADVPAVAIGGINPVNLHEVIKAGFANFAVLSYICESKKPEIRIKELQKIYRSLR